MSPFEDLCLYIVFKDNDKESSFWKIMAQKYLKNIDLHKTLQIDMGQLKSLKEKIFGQQNYTNFFSREKENNVHRIFKHIFDFIQQDNIYDDKSGFLNAVYLQVLQSIFYLYGAQAYRSDYYQFKETEQERKQNQKKLNNMNEQTLDYIQNYFIEYFSGHKLISSVIAQSYYKMSEKDWVNREGVYLRKRG